MHYSAIVPFIILFLSGCIFTTNDTQENDINKSSSSSEPYYTSTNDVSSVASSMETEYSSSIDYNPTSDKEVMESLRILIIMRQRVDSISGGDIYSCKNEEYGDECFALLAEFYEKYQEHLALVKSKSFMHLVVLDSTHSFFHATDSTYDRLDSSYACNDTSSDWELQYDTIPEYYFNVEGEHILLARYKNECYVEDYTGTGNSPYSTWYNNNALVQGAYASDYCINNTKERLIKLYHSTYNIMAYGLDKQLTLNETSFSQTQTMRFNCYYDEVALAEVDSQNDSDIESVEKIDCNNWVVNYKLGLVIQTSVKYETDSFVYSLVINYNGTECAIDFDLTSFDSHGSISVSGSESSNSCDYDERPVIEQSSQSNESNCADELYDTWINDLSASE